MADAKLTALTAITAATTDDLLYVVDNPGGTPASKKITFDNLQQSITKVGTITTGTWNGTSIGAAYGGFGWGATASGTTDGGVALTLSNSSSDGAAALKITAGNTQGNQPALASLLLGSSGNVQGLVIKGTSGGTAGDVGSGNIHAMLWNNVNSSTSKVLTVANGTSYTENIAVYDYGYIDITRQAGVTGTLYDAHILDRNSNGYVATRGTTVINSLSNTAGFYSSQLVDDGLYFSAIFNMNATTGGGLLVQGTGSTRTDELGKHLSLWGKTAGNANTMLSIGNGSSSFTERAYWLGTGALTIQPAGDLTGLTVKTDGSFAANHAVRIWDATASGDDRVLSIGNETSYTNRLSFTADGTIEQVQSKVNGYSFYQAIPASMSAGPYAGYYCTISGTQANSVSGFEIVLGASGKSGDLIRGTGSQATTAYDKHLVLWGNTAANENYVLATGNGTSYTQTFTLNANGCVVIRPAVSTSGYVVQLDMTMAAQGGLFFTDFPVTYPDQPVIQASASMSGTTLVNRTANMVNLTFQRTVSGSATTTDAFDMVKMRRDNVTSNASANLTSSGSILRLELISTQTSGTLADTTNVLFLKGDTTSTGYLIRGQVDSSTEKFNVTMTGNVIIGGSAAGSSAVNVLALSNSATAPSNSVDMVQLYSYDISAGNASLGIYVETAVVSETVVSDRTLAVKINGTDYKICLKV